MEISLKTASWIVAIWILALPAASQSNELQKLHEQRSLRTCLDNQLHVVGEPGGKDVDRVISQCQQEYDAFLADLDSDRAENMKLAIHGYVSQRIAEQKGSS